ncbi:hypothetical protein L1987_44104 [Smallanthus sonchifolius]|uniref:Uncharacterized protein n=1 Tax=Smallanthus sonchifolius TaxID=185202 RepID=A0ACB9GPJ6_9ASTR|nr:hypothetical protein L1987_44104 [Smallanthus sonchifolius]
MSNESLSGGYFEVEGYHSHLPKGDGGRAHLLSAHGAGPAHLLSAQEEGPAHLISAQVAGSAHLLSAQAARSEVTLLDLRLGQPILAYQSGNVIPSLVVDYGQRAIVTIRTTGQCLGGLSMVLMLYNCLEYKLGPHQFLLLLFISLVVTGFCVVFSAWRQHLQLQLHRLLANQHPPLPFLHQHPHLLLLYLDLLNFEGSSLDIEVAGNSLELVEEVIVVVVVEEVVGFVGERLGFVRVTVEIELLA